MSRSASRVFSVRYSCTNPRIALSRTMTTIVTASVHSPSSADMPVAASRISTIVSRNCDRKIRTGPGGLTCTRVLLPDSFLRSSACTVVSPFITSPHKNRSDVSCAELDRNRRGSVLSGFSISEQECRLCLAFFREMWYNLNNTKREQKKMQRSFS